MKGTDTAAKESETAVEGQGQPPRGEAEVGEMEAIGVPQATGDRSTGLPERKRTLAEVMAEARPSDKRPRPPSPTWVTGPLAEVIVPIDLTAETPPEERREVSPLPPSLPEANTPAAIAEAEPVAASVEKATEEAVVAGPLDTAPTPPEAEAGEAKPIYTFEAFAKKGRWAKELISQICPSDVQADFLIHGKAKFFREAAASMLWTANSLTALETWVDQANRSMSETGNEASAAKARAEAAEAELQEARAALEKAGCQVASEVEKTLAAERQANCALQAIGGLEELISSLRGEMEQKDDEVAAAKEGVFKAEARIAEADRAAAEARAITAEVNERIAESEKKRVEAVEKAVEAEGRAAKAEGEAEAKIAEAERKSSEAIDAFRQSSAFKAEILEATAYAVDAGFYACRRKMKLLFNVDGMDDVEPDTPKNMPPPSPET